MNQQDSQRRATIFRGLEEISLRLMNVT